MGLRHANGVASTSRTKSYAGTTVEKITVASVQVSTLRMRTSNLTALGVCRVGTKVLTKVIGTVTRLVASRVTSGVVRGTVRPAPGVLWPFRSSGSGVRRSLPTIQVIP